MVDVDLPVKYSPLANTSHGPLNTSGRLHVTFGFAHDLSVVPSQR